MGLKAKKKYEINCCKMVYPKKKYNQNIWKPHNVDNIPEWKTKVVLLSSRAFGPFSLASKQTYKHCRILYSTGNF